MEILQLKENGLILKRGRVVTSPVFRYLSDTIILDKGFRLISFFRVIKLYPELEQLSDILSTLLSMAFQSGEPNIKTDEIDHLIFFKTISMKGFPGDPGIDIYNSLKGIKQEKSVGLKFFQMDSLLAQKLVLGKLKHIIFGDSQDTFSYETFYTLFELIEGICWEMAFNFNPKQCVLRR
ncbi:MAG: hypothetical protein L3J69_11010 [Desulfobacula sp.]|nr:hypothetical protein [Desulfobacula sp.]